MAIVNFGSMNLDHVYRVPHICVSGETILSDEVMEFAGGKGLNQSIAAVRSGARVSHAGMLGAGGDMLRKYLDDSGVDTSLLQICDAPQGHSIIQVDHNGQNSIIVYGGSNQCVSAEYIDQTLVKCETGDYIMVQNEISCLNHLIFSAHALGLKVVLNASPVNSTLLQVDFSKVSCLIVNELECSAIAGCNSAMDAFEILQNRYPQTSILLTLGSDGSLCWADGETIHQKAYPVSVVDTTGAGDTFAGYFIGCLVNGYSRDEALRYASMAASIAVTRPGAACAIPTMECVLSALE